MTSTQRPDENTAADGPRRRRSPLAVVTVAAAVLIAGGGGAYLATASGDGGRKDAGAAPAGDSAPRPLALDGVAGSGPAVPAGPSDGPPPGIAPGEPDPHGVVYRAEGELPDGPDTARVQRAEGTVGVAEVTRLAEALGVAGVPRSQGSAWQVGTDQDGSGPLLRVEKKAPGTWTFARFAPSPGGDDCVRGKSTCAGGGIAPGEGPAVSEQAAKKAAAPVLKALGQDDAELDARRLMGAVRVVNADPVVDGLPTYGWSTGIQVGADGKVAGGSGQIKAPEPGASYPVIDADAALAELNRTAADGGGPAIGGCATAMPLEGAEPAAPCEPGTRPAVPPTRVVEKAVFGLALRAEGGRPVLVPSWLFEIAPAGTGAAYTVASTAVEPELLTRPSAPAVPPHEEPPGKKSPGGGPVRPVISYHADGSKLSVTFWAGVCGAYTARADEGGAAVRVTVFQADPDPRRACVAMAEERTVSLALRSPLADRRVVNAATGETVPRG